MAALSSDQYHKQADIIKNMIENSKIEKNYLNVHFEFLICVFIVITLFATYWGVWNYDFINFDDDIYVTENINVRTGLTIENIHWAFFNNSTYWQPFAWLSHMIDCELFGVDPGAHHLINLLLHIINSLLLFLVFRKMTGMKWECAFIAVVFAFHPLSIDSVAWIAERKNVLSTLWWILGIWSYSFYSENPGISRYLLTLIFFIFGLMTKAMCVTMPFVFLLLDYWPLDRYRRMNEIEGSIGGNSLLVKLKNIDIFHRILEKTPFFAITLIYLYVFFLTLKEVGTITKDIAPVTLRISNALTSYVLYIWKIILPHDLAIYYPFPKSIPVWQSTGSALLLIFMTALLIRSMRKMPYLMVGWFWYVGTLVPVIGLIQSGRWPQIADRWIYVPQIGLYVMIAFGASKVISELHLRRRLIILITSILLVTMITTTWFQVKYWKNSITLFQHAINVTQDNMLAHYNLGTALIKENRVDEAMIHFLSAIKIVPNHPNANYNLGLAQLSKGSNKKAIYYFKNYMRMKPNDPKVYSRIGFSYFKIGEKLESKKYYLKALEINDKFEEAHFGLGVVFSSEGNIDRSVFHYSEALRLKPDFIDAHINIGNIYFKKNLSSLAETHYKKAIGIDPRYVTAYMNLGMLMLKHGNIEKAQILFEKVNELKPNDKKIKRYLEVIDNLNN